VGRQDDRKGDRKGGGGGKGPGDCEKTGDGR